MIHLHTRHPSRKHEVETGSKVTAECGVPAIVVEDVQRLPPGQTFCIACKDNYTKERTAKTSRGEQQNALFFCCDPDVKLRD